MGFVILFNENVKASDVKAVVKKLDKNNAIASMEYTSPDVVLQRWQDMIGEDEDILKLGGVNPFVAELEVRVKPKYAVVDSIEKITAPLLMLPHISEIKIHSELVEQVNSSLRSISLSLLIVALALLIISFVLIFNTVRLAVYARRFSIYTMKLVGATASFIRRPFLIDNLINGFAAGILASIVLMCLQWYLYYVDFTISTLISWSDLIPLMIALILLGMLICVVAAFLATNRYLRLSYDEMFK